MTSNPLNAIEYLPMTVFEFKISFTFDNDRENFLHEQLLQEKHLFDSTCD